ncbi:lanthionine synthetase C family protein [Asanoa siamensis]|uniref:Lanthionine synthetase-like protein n=1 Tax=Asanoa siamensis TaxID=926357 RepID=A0ABQ4CQL3_9ACTN|nr:lanthionine synthetase C family protein [Asanoa siamensis]GIF73575.1 hypothetical protein Asi02nite_30930 [Asanoa siamensis]
MTTSFPHHTELAAAAIVSDLAARLADHEAVATVMTAQDNARKLVDGSAPVFWSDLSLADGYPALALLYAELGHLDPGYRRVAHAYLEQAATRLTEAPPGGLYAGSVALAFAASCAAQRPTDYAGILEPLDRSLAAWVPARVGVERVRIEAGLPGTTFASYDVIGGMTGVGRYLLNRGPETRPALTEILTYLCALTKPFADDLPGWWVTHAPDSDVEHGGHLNLGLAHGIPGPLALLALAWQAGIRVPDQDAAIARIVGWLLDWRITDSAGVGWPATVEPGDLAGPPDQLCMSRSSWCYGVPGVARALQLAGQALGESSWTSAAVASIRDMLNRPNGFFGIEDPGLCHGWAGLLHLVRLIGIDADDAAISGAATGLAASVVGRYDDNAPFGFRATNPPALETVDLAGFLEGAAGVALALASYVHGGRPASGWDAALLAR